MPSTYSDRSVPRRLANASMTAAMVAWSGASSSVAKARAKILPARSTEAVVGGASRSPSSAAIEVDATPGIPHGSMSSKSARSTVTLRAIPW